MNRLQKTSTILATTILAAATVLAAPSLGSTIGTTSADIYERTDYYLFSASLEEFAGVWNAQPKSGADALLSWSADDCSKSPDAFLGRKFDDACRRHDFGYRNYKLQGRFTEANRRRIDDTLRSDLLKACGNGSSLSARACRTTARLYRRVVRIAGDWFAKGRIPVAVVIPSSRSGRCLDAPRSSAANGTPVSLWDCNNQNRRNGVQTAAFRNIKGMGTLEFAVNGGRKCLDADLNTIGGNGTKVQLWDCNGQSQQFWIVTGKDHRGYEIRNGRDVTKCLDADLNTIGGNGTRVQLWDCNGQSQQRWRTLYW
ncbi:phospholipase A2 [Nonomuraea soli]|uniref:Ricin B lectin domain-containing protein n=1 Tax=Nonomuraea soli TaxID=1032476 RepID=A0A7W0CFG6_9ACTN|nr:phospholipase A2 [Nonomuraea soli]MBA2890057.1 hypothetical protein [Nonomuraea soli]